MKIKIGCLIFALFVILGNLYAQDVTTVKATGSDISDNLDLEAVASLFGEAKDLEDFEKKLNDSETRISNLDLNGDGVVDYLRVVETSENETRLVTIQAVIGKNKYQDVATIDVEKDSEGKTQVQVVGDVYMYGPDYIITPVYVQRPVIIVWYWGPSYHPWRSPYYWRHYPPYYRRWHPYHTHRYRTHVHVHINAKNSYHHTSVRKSKTAKNLHNKSRRNDYGSKHPNKSFAKRNKGIKNKQDLKQKRDTEKVSGPKTKDAGKSTGKKVQDDWKPASEKNRGKSKVKDNKVSTPSKKANTQPYTQPANKPVYKPAQKPVNRPAQKPANRPAQKPKRR